MTNLTRSEIMSMTAEQLRVAVAKLKGWKYQQEAPRGYTCPTSGDCSGWWISANGKEVSCAKCQDALPDYPHDIAAAYELENEIPEDSRPDYAILLYWVVVHEQGKRDDWDAVHATAEQRCRAYLMLSEESEK